MALGEWCCSNSNRRVIDLLHVLSVGTSIDGGKWAAGIWRAVISCQSVRVSHKRLKNLRSFVIWLLLVLSHFLQLMEPGGVLNTTLDIWIWNKILNKTRQHWPQKITDLKKPWTSKELHSRDPSCEGKCCHEEYNCQTTLYPWAELSRDLMVLSQWKEKSILQKSCSYSANVIWNF